MLPTIILKNQPERRGGDLFDDRWRLTIVTAFILNFVISVALDFHYNVGVAFPEHCCSILWTSRWTAWLIIRCFITKLRRKPGVYVFSFVAHCHAVAVMNGSVVHDWDSRSSTPALLQAGHHVRDTAASARWKARAITKGDWPEERCKLNRLKLILSRTLAIDIYVFYSVLTRLQFAQRG